ncbi:6791_t:CDS:2 [Entrophospora sp. SA101]|nr:6791_t:CDS:2 [Entrophospora sp. SA101]
MSFLNKLSINFGSLLNEAYDYNVLISVGSKPNTKEFKAHSSVLRVRSLYFEHEFSNKWINQKNNIIELPKIDPVVFSLLLNGGYNNSIFNFGCGDLMMNNNCISCNGGSNNYKQLNLLNNNSNKFYASEIEAFKVQLNG